MIETPAGTIRMWRPPGLRQLELRRGVGIAETVPRHWHDEFQLCLIEAGDGELTYRRANHPTPPASLFVVHPGEVHSNRPYERCGCTYRSLFVPPETVRAVCADLSGRDHGIPFFAPAVLFEPSFLARFRRLHLALEQDRAASALERQSLLLSFLGDLILRASDRASYAAHDDPKRPAVRRAVEYLSENYADNVRLETLSGLAGLSEFHFSRVFSEQVGMPPHLFQIQVRVARAKQLLARGESIARAAAQTGFADQSHLTRHFTRLVGITPGQFRQGSKNVQYGARRAR